MQVPVASPENSRHSGLEGMLFQNTSTKTTSACVSRDSPLQQSFFSKKVHFIPYLHLDPLTAQAFWPLVPTCVVHASSQSTQNCTGLFGGLFHTDLYAVLPCTTIYCHLVPHLYCMHAAERERCTFVCSQICTLAPHFKSAPLLLLLSSFPCVCFHLLFRKSACYTTLICNLNFFPQLCWPQISCRPSGTLCLCHSAGHAMSPHHHASPRQLASWQHFQLEAAAPPHIGFSAIDFRNWIPI